MYNKEYYWSDAHTFFNNPYYCGLEWVNIDSDRLNYVFPGKVLIPVKQYYTATYTLSPYEMVYTNEHYYLICVPDHDPYTRLYRIDRMANIRILGEPRSETPAQEQEAQDAVYAFVGAPERVVLNCDRAVLDDVLDRFGTDIQVFERDEQTFTAVLTTPPRGVRFWALQYLSFVEVAEPAWLRQEIIESIARNQYTNRKNG